MLAATFGDQGLERGSEADPVLANVGVALFGQGGELAAVDRLDADQAGVFQGGQSRIDGTGARAPGPLSAVSHRLHQLVAVHGLLSEQDQDRDPHVAALGPAAAAAAPVVSHAMHWGPPNRCPKTGLRYITILWDFD